MQTRHILLAATLIAGGAGAAIAQGAMGSAVTYDPAQLPAIQGKVASYSLTPRGDVEGLILTDGTEVHMAPHLGTQLVFAVKPGDAVTIRGLKARSVPMVQAMSITNDATSTAVTDNGPSGGPPDGPGRGGPRGPRSGADQQQLTAQGRIKAALHGRQGEVNGAILEDGTIVRLPPPEAQRLAAQLTPGSALYVQGQGYAGLLGRVIAARAIGPSEAQAMQIAAPSRPEPGRRPPPGGPGAPPPPAAQ